MKPYRKHHSSHLMTFDERPKGRDKHFCERKVREDAKREIRSEIKELNNCAQLDYEDMIFYEMQDAWNCYMYGACPVCNKSHL